MKGLYVVLNKFLIRGKVHDSHGYFEFNQENILSDSLLRDRFGFSKVEDFLVEGDNLGYKQIYCNHSDEDISFKYSFEKVNGIWRGSYTEAYNPRKSEKSLISFFPTNVSKVCFETILREKLDS